MLPEKGTKRTQVFNWLFWLHDSAPCLDGNFGRFAMKIKRQLDVLDKQLAQSEFIAGDEYSIADMATWPWYGNLV